MGKFRLAHRRGKGKPSPVDVHVGARMRIRRTLLGMNQTELSDVLGLSYQQVQKYESGANRMGASRLYDLARVLDVPVTFFFKEMPVAVAASSPALGGTKAKEPPSYEPNPMAKRETLQLVRAYYKITDPLIRKRLREMTKAVAADV